MQKHNTICPQCGARMRRNGRTRIGTERFRCMACGRSETKRRADVRLRHGKDRFTSWLAGIESKAAVAKRYGVSRWTLTREFASFVRNGADDPGNPPPEGYGPRIVIADAKFIDGNRLCALVALTESDRIFWQFASAENETTWTGFMRRFAPPAALVADGEKGLTRFVKRCWPGTKFQRCHFHLVKLVIQYLSRNPKEEPGRRILELAYRLKTVKTHGQKATWLTLWKIWEKQYAWYFKQKTPSGEYQYRKVRSVRTIMRNAVPDLFAYLDVAGCPNTTNDVEGWINATIAERVARHRGMRPREKEVLVSTVLSHLTREKPKRKSPPEKHT
jgi:Transposase, Mutator family